MTNNSDILSIALVGYGSMGKELERLAPERQCRVAAIFDEHHSLSAGSEHFYDVAIDFSAPSAVMDNIRLLAEQKKNIILGTTGWYDRQEEVQRIVEEAGIGLVYGSNFSVGMQIFFRIVRRAAELVNRYNDYDVFLHELHHRRKVDSPSGTALTLASILMEEVERKTLLLTETSHEKIKPEELHVTSTRGGETPGTHTVYLDSAADTIELTHRARNRSGFALGALYAAHWIQGKAGFYEFGEVVGEAG